MVKITRISNHNFITSLDSYMTPTELKTKLELAFEEAKVEVIDLTGTADHYRVIVETTHFKGVLPIKRHRMVNEVLKSELASGEIHALQLETYSPCER